ncbi:uncharacterized protein LOC127882004 [Dreissena polymorpha]|nr:uncharacterized protein LOC127882004 [Dreissena polymorpha]
MDYYCQDHHHLVCVSCINERKHIACEISRASHHTETSVTRVNADLLSSQGQTREENSTLEKTNRAIKPESYIKNNTRPEKADLTVIDRSNSRPNHHQDTSKRLVVPSHKSRPSANQAIITSGADNRVALSTKEQPIFNEIARFKMSLVEHLDKLEDDLKKEMEVLCSNYEEMMQCKIDGTRKLRDAIQNALNMANNADPEGVAPQSMRDECDEYERMTKEERTDFKDVELKFMPEDNLSVLANTVKQLGRVNALKKQNQNRFSKPFIHRSAQITGLLNGKRDGDTKDSIFNSVDMGSSGDIIVADFNNCSVKLFDHTGMFLSQMKLSSVPRGVCFVEDKTAAISLPKEGIIKLMSIEGNFLTHLKDLHTSFKAYRMCGYRSKLLGICYSQGTRSVSVVEQSGQIGKTITKRKDKTGHGGVAYDPAKNLTYMSDREQICCYGDNGDVIFRNTFRRADLRGMTLDCQGNLYVCSHETKSVLQIDQNGTLAKSISVPIPPQDVAIQPMGNTMVVVGLGNVAYVYNLT